MAVLLAQCRTRQTVTMDLAPWIAAGLMRLGLLVPAVVEQAQKLGTSRYRPQMHMVAQLARHKKPRLVTLDHVL